MLPIHAARSFYTIFRQSYIILSWLCTCIFICICICIFLMVTSRDRIVRYLGIRRFSRELLTWWISRSGGSGDRTWGSNEQFSRSGKNHYFHYGESSINGPSMDIYVSLLGVSDTMGYSWNIHEDRMGIDWRYNGIMD